MRSGKREKSNTDFLFLLVLFAVFLLCALIVVSFGSRIYQKTVADAEERFSARTAVAYLTEKFRQNDTAGGVSLQTCEGIPLIVFSVPIGQQVYHTYLYFQDNRLKEYTADAENAFSFDYGTPVLTLADFHVTEENGVFSFCIAGSENDSVSFHITPRTLMRKAGDENE